MSGVTKPLRKQSSRLRVRPDLVLFDFDGVLTDNRVHIGADGSESVICSRSDGMGFDLFRTAGVKAAVVSSERNQVARHRARKLRIPVLLNVRDKDLAVREYVKKLGIPLAKTMFVGNDINDIPAMRIVGISVCPADGHPLVRRIANVVLRTSGGDGVAREIAERLLGLTDWRHPGYR